MAEPVRTPRQHQDHAPEGHDNPVHPHIMDHPDSVIDNRRVVENRGPGSGAIIVGIILVLAIVGYFVIAPRMGSQPAPSAPATTSEPATPEPAAPAPMTPTTPTQPAPAQ